MRKFWALTLVCFFLMAGMVSASGHGGAALSPAQALKKIVTGNDQFVKSHDPSYFAPYQTSQHPFVTMITCSDARVQTNALLPDAIDKVFVIRNIGNQLVVSKGSIDYGVLHLHTPILLILGHTHCGAVKAAMGDYRGETEGIRNELDHLHLPLMADNGKGDFEKRWLKNVERNVDWQVAEAMSFYPDLVKSGKLVVVGAVYDFLNVYGKGYGRMVIINVNGVTCPKKLQNHPVLQDLSKVLRKVVVGSHH